MAWRDGILSQFVPGAARLTLAADPDGLLLEEGIVEGIRARGFELLTFEDSVGFRYAYESGFRSRWDSGEDAYLVVVVQSPPSALVSLPHDLLQAGRRITFSLAEIFPNLSYSVVATLDRGDLDALYTAQALYAPGPLGENASKEFVLRQVFGTAPELIGQPSDLLRALLRRHHLGQRVPPPLDARLIQLLRQNRCFGEWPLEVLVPDREAFFAFIQERWPIFLEQFDEGEKGVHEGKAAASALSIPGPPDLPFAHHDIRVYIDSLFLEGLLQPVSHPQGLALAPSWATVGIRTAPAQHRRQRLTQLVDRLHASLPAEDARHDEWLRFARVWAELSILAYGPTQSSGTCSDRVMDLQSRVDDAFGAWVLRRYGGLISLPPSPPVMLHHLPRHLTRRLQDTHGKVALVMVDGLALDQWLVIREALELPQSRYRVREHAVFSWIPSITPVSRQAAFAGKPPIYFPDSIQGTDREASLWRQFWADQGLVGDQVVYRRGLGDGSLDAVREAISHPKARVAGLVIDTVDQIMHGMQLGRAGMLGQVRQWAQQGYLMAFLSVLLEQGFVVFMASDHGNVEALGLGRPSEGAMAHVRGERVRIFSDASLRRQVKVQFPDALEWDPVGLPADLFALLAPSRRAFAREGERIVTHGGISIEEIIVPLVEIERYRA